MSKDINKQIEEEAIEVARYNPKDPKYEGNWYGKELCVGMYSGYIKGYNACLNSSRWRKVSEEMPDSNIDVLCKIERGTKYLCKYEGVEQYFYDSNDYEVISNVIEWKPID